jgi:SAM-dependent methyltransferase
MKGRTRAPDFPVLVDRLAALGDPTRLRILLLLDQGELNVGEIAQVLQLPLSSVSRHLRTLQEREWILARPEGTSRVFRLAPGGEEEARSLWQAVRTAGSQTPEILADRERGTEVLALRRERARTFFRTEGGRWDALRDELFGRRAAVLPLLGLLDPDSVVGDLGCGTGALTQLLSLGAGRVVAIDREPRMLEAARERLAGAEEGCVDFRVGDLESLPLGADELDVAFLVLVLHLVPDPVAVLAEAARVVRPGGRVILVDMRPHDREQYRSEMGHLWTGFAPELLSGWLEEAGLEGGGVIPLPPEAEARGPLLFVTSARVPGPSSVSFSSPSQEIVP